MDFTPQSQSPRGCMGANPRYSSASERAAQNCRQILWGRGEGILKGPDVASHQSGVRPDGAFIREPPTWSERGCRSQSAPANPITRSRHSGLDHSCRAVPRIRAPQGHLSSSALASGFEWFVSSLTRAVRERHLEVMVPGRLRRPVSLAASPAGMERLCVGSSEI